MKYRRLLAILPAGLGLLLAGLVALGAFESPIVYLRIDLGSLALLAGLLLSGLLWAGLSLWGRARRGYQGQLEAFQAGTLADRRRFLRRLDHELKNPLTAIRAGLANLADSAGRSEALGSVEAETLRLSRLVTDLRKLAELDTLPFERVAINLAELLTEALHLAQEQPAAQTRQLNLILPQAPWPLPAIYGDWDLLYLAIYNLLDNALKFSRDDDTIELRAFEAGRWVVVEVADTGPGIPAEELSYVWQELYRGGGARQTPGSGLGLALVRAIIERHNGAITLRSRVEQGTVATVRLPLS